MYRTRGSGTLDNRHGWGSFWRAPISLIAALAVFVALLHCQCAAAQSTGFLPASVVAVDLKASPAELPDNQLPGHGGHCAHCLCHVAYQILTGSDSILIQFGAAPYTIRKVRSSQSLAGLPLFKPPRI